MGVFLAEHLQAPATIGPSGPAFVPRLGEPMAKRGDDIDWMSVRINLYMRSGGKCEFCRRPLNNSAHIHHRKLRSQGGGHEEANLALICVADHEWAHANPVAARAHGWIVSGSLEPSETPVTTCSTRMEGCQHGG